MSQYGPGDRPPKVRRKAKQAKQLKALSKSLPSGPPPPKDHKTPVVTVGHIKHVHEAKVARNRVLKKAQAQHDVGGKSKFADLQIAADAQQKKLVKKKQKGGLLGTADAVATKVAPAVAATAFPAVTAGLAGVQKLTGAKTLDTAKKVTASAPADAAELAVTTPSSLAKLGSTAVTHPEKVPGMLADPYENLVEHPEWALTHPVSTVLMLDPAVRAPGAVAGKVARRVGKQTLERPAATVPGTALREARTGSRDVTVRKVQARSDRALEHDVPDELSTVDNSPGSGNRVATMTDKQIGRRVDEFYDFSRQHQQRVVRSATKQAKARGYDAEKTSEHIEGARGGAKVHMANRFLEEFGPEVPDVAMKRLQHHFGVGSSRAVGAKVFKTAGKSFRGAVLPLSMRWLAGQVIEPGVRAALTGAGPTSLLREAKVYRALEKERPGAGEEFRMRTSGGGQLGLTGTAREFADGRSLADEFKGTSLEKPATAATKAGALPGVRHIRQGWHAYTSVVFDVINQSIEQTARRAMAGKAMTKGPLMERHILTLSDNAIQDAARGYRATENQVALGRAVDKMFGQYQKFSPDKRETLLHTTPFLPWCLNTAQFVLSTLPKDHPVAAALIADLDAATEEWRKAHGLSLRGPGRVPDFLLGTAPVGDGRFRPVGKYMPFVPADVAGAVGDLALPQFSGPVKNLTGVDWKGQPIRGGQDKRVIQALKSAAEAHVPGVTTAEGVVQRGAHRQFWPFTATSTPKVRRKGSGVRVKPVRVKPVRVLPLGGKLPLK